jgi:hypothetical protein
MSEENKIQEQNASQKAEWKRFFNYQWIVKNVPFFFFIAALTVLYIYNGHYADRLARNISVTEKNIKELEYDYKTIESEVIFRSKASELEKAVEPLGLKEPIKPPMKLDDDTASAGATTNQPQP